MRWKVKKCRPATLDDFKLLIQSLNNRSIEYFLIGGYALLVHGSTRSTSDIDILVPATYISGVKVREALMDLPGGVARDIDPVWFEEGDVIRVGDAFTVDVMFKTCGETYETLKKHAELIEFEGIQIRTLTLEGLLKTKQTQRDKDVADRNALAWAINSHQQHAVKNSEELPLNYMVIAKEY